MIASHDNKKINLKFHVLTLKLLPLYPLQILANIKLLLSLITLHDKVKRKTVIGTESKRLK